ncbi:unnamed protein product [Paramecium sonneborni]|uniref:Uncharacterized protein n=1 Tax=Paramecium sonneborni TaxID=65129 RepID=A0A8S1RUM1_9CILI|nr:unnamed protein product [Paramecium sonneborni]
MNIEQIKHLQWQGSYGDQSQKIGNWTASWKDQILNDVGGLYSNDGKKIGFWKELFQNYCSQTQAFKFGEYQDNRKCGDWMYIYRDINIGGGFYNNLGQKSGYWRTLSKNFWDLSQVIYKGLYENGQKIGKWDINWKIPQGINVFEQMYLKQQQYYSLSISGGGSFNENNMTNGIWIELCDVTTNLYLVVNIRMAIKLVVGLVVGEIIMKQMNLNKCIQIENFLNISGGGLYNDQGTKIGTWIEMSDNFNMENQVIYIGEYKNSKKVGKWNIQWRLNKCYPFLIIGGGYYSVNNLKIGKWIELSENYENGNQCIFYCEYKDGKYFGISDILWREYIGISFYQIGGGIFDQQSYKNGK